MRFKEFLVQESTADKNILKALFVIGVAGSGKSFLVNSVKSLVKLIDYDIGLEFLAKRDSLPIGKEGSSLAPLIYLKKLEGKKREEAINQIAREYDLTIEQVEQLLTLPDNVISTLPAYNKDAHALAKQAYTDAKNIQLETLTHAVNGCLPLIMAVVGDDINKLKTRIDALAAVGYDIGVIWVHTDLNRAMANATTRRVANSKDLHRYINQAHIKNSYNKLVNWAHKIDSTLSSLGPVEFFEEVVMPEAEWSYQDDQGKIKNTAEINAVIAKVGTISRKFLTSPLKNEKGIELLATMKTKKQKYLLPEIYSKEELGELVNKMV